MCSACLFVVLLELQQYHFLAADRVGWTDGFVRTVGVGIARGCYPEALIEEWHRWDEEFTSENDAVDAFGSGQLYTVRLTGWVILSGQVGKLLQSALNRPSLSGVCF